MKKRAITKRYWMLVLLLWGQGLVLQAQNTTEQIAIPLSKPGEPGVLKVHMMHGDLQVKGYEGKEVVLRMQLPEEQASMGPAKNGLRKITNNNFGLEVREENNVVSVESMLMQRNGNGHLEVLVPRRFSLKLQTVNGEQVAVDGVNGEIEVSNVNGSIRLTNVEGSAMLNTVNGDIHARFEKITPDVPMAFTNLNGTVEVSFPASASFSTKAKTEHGSVYTDFDMKLRQERERVKTSTKQGVYRVNVDNWVQGDVNGGGPEFLFKSLNGDILIRKN